MSVFIIAEAGVNHNGDMSIAYKLIDAAIESGADAIKFQTFKAERLVTRTAAKAEYQQKTTNSLESQFEDKYGQTPKGMVESADYNIKFLEDLGFEDIKVSLKASDVQRTVESYRMLRTMNNYPFHLGVTEAGNFFHATIKSSIE